MTASGMLLERVKAEHTKKKFKKKKLDKQLLKRIITFQNEES